MSIKFLQVALGALLIIALLTVVMPTEANEKDKADEKPSIGGTVGRLAAETVGVATAAVPALVGKAALRAGSIRYTTQAFSVVARGVLPSRMWRTAAVFTGTRISKYLTSGWIPCVSVAFMAYDGYQLAQWMLSDEEKN